MTEVKMKTKIEENIVKKRKIIGIIADKLEVLIGLDKLKISNNKMLSAKIIKPKYFLKR